LAIPQADTATMRAVAMTNAIRRPQTRTALPRLLRLFSALAVLCSTSAVTAEPPSEAAVKAAFVYNFTKFIEWPAPVPADAPLTICIAGTRSELAASLIALDGKSAQGRTVEVKNNVQSADIESCHVLFLGQHAQALASYARRQVGLLTVSDMPNFVQTGGIIGLFTEGDRIRFAISPRNAEAAGLKVSSQLVKLAKVTERQ
jgi:YfiR/HmsC-like